MKQLLLNLLTALALALLPAMTLGSPVYAAASCGTPSASKTQVLKGIGQAGGNCDASGVTKVISAGVNVLSIVIGVAAIIAIMSSGFKYITSGGESGRIANAKNTLIYALVGLAIAGLAQFLVHFVLGTTVKSLH